MSLVVTGEMILEAIEYFTACVNEAFGTEVSDALRFLLERHPDFVSDAIKAGAELG